MECIPVFSGGPLCPGKIISVGFVDNDRVGHFDDPPFDPLQFVARAGDHQQQEKVDHGMDRCFRLPHANRFDKDGIVSGCFAKNDRFMRFSRHSSQHPS